MIEIRIHGRGGQGSVTAAELLGFAAFNAGKFVQAFPAFGSERMGAPVKAFLRIAEKEIRVHSQIYTPDYVIVQDPTLLATVPVLQGLKPDGVVIVNTKKTPEELNLDTKCKVITFDAWEIATRVIGRPIANTILMGAFAAASGQIPFEGIEKAINARFKGDVAKKNVAAAKEAYELIKGGKNESKSRSNS
ncbi:MAG: pyruvate ferredoxin oxidoreductase [Candidatus Wallbacteria bacterium GWC2_49_35]|uniref:Pyruvate ferredoxin oxidoreductase n=1 Tax=Candidatus Wallbacteria bacterium GWC2_49_35 TaxID=1817813 RepID=A0A1F7WLE1_9BACT|nr:MAG: pyruvate ferredoxin oxidoreductase [Candidatus Wallbacteria bacterium GWC2_49_35]HBC76141.1 pyruvate ferredoxin oxidoreductase [Candidatus Wallbacteria bacterium]